MDTKKRVFFAALAVAVVATVAAAEPDRSAPKPDEKANAPTSDDKANASAPKPGEERKFDATAYSQHGETAAGTPARPGVVAADPKVLPPGSEIQVEDAGPHSGTYRVEDTGPAIRGKEIDVFVPNKHEAKKFGRKQVKVKVLRRGEHDGKRAERTQASKR